MKVMQIYVQDCNAANCVHDSQRERVEMHACVCVCVLLYSGPLLAWYKIVSMEL